MGLWLKDGNYTSFQFDPHPGSLFSYKGGLRSVHPDLEAGGVNASYCCYLVSFVREDLIRAGTPRGLARLRRE